MPQTKFTDPNCPVPDLELTLGEHVEAWQQAGYFEDGRTDLGVVLRHLCNNLSPAAQAAMAQELGLRPGDE
jgi:hypothetical protein